MKRIVPYIFSMKFNAYKILAILSVSVFFTSCNPYMMMGTAPPQTVSNSVVPVPVPKNVKYVAPTVKPTAPLNPSNNFSRDISGSKQK